MQRFERQFSIGDDRIAVSDDSDISFRPQIAVRLGRHRIRAQLRRLQNSRGPSLDRV